MAETDPPRVLLVEDEPLIRMLTVDMLDAIGIAAVEVGTGAEALAIDDATLAGHLFAGLIRQAEIDQQPR